MYRNEVESLRASVQRLTTQVVRLEGELAHHRESASRWKSLVDKATEREARRKANAAKQQKKDARAAKRRRKLEARARAGKSADMSNTPSVAFVTLVLGAPMGIAIGAMAGQFAHNPWFILYGALIGAFSMGTWALGRS